MQTHLDDLVANPNRHFSRPDDVLSEPTLSADEKRRILESWKQDAQRLAESTAENMNGGEESDLRDVSKVLIELNTSQPAVAARQPRRGGARPSEGGRLLTGALLGGLLGAGAGLLLTTMTAPSMAIVAQAAAVGLILGGVGAALRKPVRS